MSLVHFLSVMQIEEEKMKKDKKIELSKIKPEEQLKYEIAGELYLH